MNIAIFSPNQNSYSETFIQAHKKYLKASNLYYIYGGKLYGMHIENVSQLISTKKQLLVIGLAKIKGKDFEEGMEPSVAKRLKA